MTTTRTNANIELSVWAITTIVVIYPRLLRITSGNSDVIPKRFLPIKSVKCRLGLDLIAAKQDETA